MSFVAQAAIDRDLSSRIVSPLWVTVNGFRLTFPSASGLNVCLCLFYDVTWKEEEECPKLKKNVRVERSSSIRQL